MPMLELTIRKKKREISPRRKRIKRILLYCTLTFILVIILIDIIKHPLYGSLYSIVGGSKSDIVEVQVNHYGKTVHVTDRKSVEYVVELFDCNLKRRDNDYIAHTTGYGISLTFVMENGAVSKSFAFSPNDIYGRSAQIFLDHYYYDCDKEIGSSFIESLWDMGLKEDD